jgi:succinate dehydrogenase hydrophobic anchor subunit
MTVQTIGATVTTWGVVIIFLGIILLDTYAVWKNKGATDTISAHLRNWNSATGGLLALTSAALWVHLFVGLPASWTETAAIPFRQSEYDRLVH